MNIGQNIMNLRKSAKLSQEQLAEKMGVTRQTISNWELDESSPDLKQGKKLSKIFNVSLDDLTGDSTFEYLGETDSERKITIISSIENVIVTCNKIQSSSKYKGGKDSPQYALFGSDESNATVFGANNTFLGWYADKEQISKEIMEIKEAFMSGTSSYELKYNVEVEKQLMGMKLRIKK
ncbi:MAG: helix-turn-helix transcriptional regulator [Clostridia bacterium]|nr:helix-turn-helix transcriptional regulator [Clostridia bacterium]